jgi:hypothetical protein
LANLIGEIIYKIPNTMDYKIDFNYIAKINGRVKSTLFEAKFKV